MNASFLIVFASCMFFIVGCDLREGRTPLEKTTNEIKQGMNLEQINNLFKDFQSSAILDFNGELKNVGDSSHKMVAFKTNSFVGFQVHFFPSRNSFLSPFEICTVYYDTNKNVIGYYYIIDH